MGSVAQVSLSLAFVLSLSRAATHTTSMEVALRIPRPTQSNSTLCATALTSGTFLHAHSIRIISLLPRQVLRCSGATSRVYYYVSAYMRLSSFPLRLHAGHTRIKKRQVRGNHPFNLFLSSSRTKQNCSRQVSTCLQTETKMFATSVGMFADRNKNVPWCFGRAREIHVCGKNCMWLDLWWRALPNNDWTKQDLVRTDHTSV
jgi:hypothetical protein